MPEAGPWNRNASTRKTRRPGSWKTGLGHNLPASGRGFPGAAGHPPRLVHWMSDYRSLSITILVFGWRALTSYGTGYLYGAVVLVILGFFLATGPILPVWRPSAGDSASSGSRKTDETDIGRRSVEAGKLFFRAALIGGALLALTGLSLKFL